MPEELTISETGDGAGNLRETEGTCDPGAGSASAPAVPVGDVLDSLEMDIAVVTDLNMPHLDGLGLIRALRKLAPNIPVIVSTGLGEKLPRAELKVMNVDVILNKPNGSETLLRALDDVLHPKGH